MLTLSGLHRAGAKDEALSGDKRLRRDVSQLIGVMAKQGMVTDRQRLFLLAQVNTRAPPTAPHHTHGRRLRVKQPSRAVARPMVIKRG